MVVEKHRIKASRRGMRGEETIKAFDFSAKSRL
jgi:hypothetical protein